MERDRHNPVSKWLAVIVPGMSAGIGWALTAGWPIANRILAGIAIGLAIYAAIHFAMKAIHRNDN